LTHLDIVPFLSKYSTIINYKGNKTEQDKRDAFKMANLAKILLIYLLKFLLCRVDYFSSA
jgi:hypothetical protein